MYFLPSFNEGMALAALEAMGAGLPLVLPIPVVPMSWWRRCERFHSRWGDVEALAGHLRRLARIVLAADEPGSRQRAAQFSWRIG
jgi:glycosyltransferase involved in cell wall biosynthesis